MLHCADISHPAKPWEIHKEWTLRLVNEFFRQGDMEKELGRPCSPLCDRNTTRIPESQIGEAWAFFQCCSHIVVVTTSVWKLFSIHTSGDI